VSTRGLVHVLTLSWWLGLLDATDTSSVLCTCRSLRRTSGRAWRAVLKQLERSEEENYVGEDAPVSGAVDCLEADEKADSRKFWFSGQGSRSIVMDCLEAESDGYWMCHAHVPRRREFDDSISLRAWLLEQTLRTVVEHPGYRVVGRTIDTAGLWFRLKAEDLAVDTSDGGDEVPNGIFVGQDDDAWMLNAPTDHSIHSLTCNVCVHVDHERQEIHRSLVLQDVSLCL